ncbi:MAG TPA: hypothetical protein VM285_00140 [Polyangia bacterium]|nr:hypothetical protein [Polyangia bacterium]HUW16924.1 hypothetical protein [Actinomycetes bacterium]
MPKKPVLVVPVPGRYITGVPHVAHECDDPFCVESGAFTIKEPDEPPAKPDTDKE